MLDLRVAATFEDIDESDQVAVDVGMRILQRVTDTSLRRQMNACAAR